MQSTIWIDSQSPMIYRTVIPYESNELSVVEAGYNRVPAGIKATRLRSVYILHYVLSGKGSINGQVFSKGDVYVVVPGEREYTVADEEDPYETVWIMFRGDRAADMLASVDISCRNHVFRFPAALACGKLISDVVFRHNYSSGWSETLTLQMLLYQVLACHAHYCAWQEGGNGYGTLRQGKSYRGAQAASRYIEQNYDRPITMKNVAHYVNFSVNYLCSMFKKEVGMSPQQYLIACRIEKARYFLKFFPELSVGDVAESCGFADPLYFSRIFRKKMGMSPSQYRKCYQKDR